MIVYVQRSAEAYSYTKKRMFSKVLFPFPSTGGLIWVRPEQKNEKKRSFRTFSTTRLSLFLRFWGLSRFFLSHMNYVHTLITYERVAKEDIPPYSSSVVLTTNINWINYVDIQLSLRLEGKAFKNDS